MYDTNNNPWNISPYVSNWGSHIHHHNHSSSTARNGFEIYWQLSIDEFYFYDKRLLSLNKDINGHSFIPTYNEVFVPLYYSFDYGNAHFISLSSEFGSELDYNQKLWLENDLINLDRTLTPFIIVLLNRPLHASKNESKGHLVAMKLLKAYNPILTNFKVDLIISGYVHAYYNVNIVDYDKYENYDKMIFVRRLLLLHLTSILIILHYRMWSIRQI